MMVQLNLPLFSQAHENWPDEINREGVTDTVDYYERVKAWYCAL